MKDTTNNAIILLAGKAGVLQPKNEQDQGYRYFTFNNSEYAIYPDRKDDYLFRIQNPENVEVNASQRENIVNGLERKLSLDSSSQSSALSITPPKSSLVTSSSEEEIDTDVLELLKNRNQIGKEVQESRQKQQVLGQQIKEHDKSIQNSEKSIQNSEKSIQQVKEWEKKELQRLNNELQESKKQRQAFHNETQRESGNWKNTVQEGKEKKKGGCVIF